MQTAMPNSASISATHLLILILMLSVILAGLLIKFRTQKAAQPRQARQPFRIRRLLARLLRLAGFGLLSLLLIVVVLMVYEDYQTVKIETAPAFRQVDLPPDLPFPVEEITFSGAGQTRLAGWYVPSANGATIILLHGYGGTRADMLWQAQTLVKSGYGVLLYDERASGESGGQRRSYGWEDGPDVSGAIAFIKERNGDPASRIGICGCSIGGQIALQGAILNPEIAAVWADGPSNIRAVDSPPPHNLISGLVLVSNYLLDFMYERQLGIPAPPPMIDRIASIAPRPLMLVGGGTELGLFGSEAARIRRYADFAGSNAQVWIIEEAVHCDGPVNRPQEYSQRLVQFFDAAFAPDP